MDYQREYQRLIKRYERMFTPVIFRAIKKQLDQYLEKGNINDIKSEPVFQALEKLYLKVGVNWATKTDKQIRQDLKLPRLGGYGERMARLIKREYGTTLVNMSEDITGTTKDRIRTILRNAIDKPLTLSELAKEIQSPEINTRRARTIARTETIRAANAASLANVNDKGYIVQKKWLAVIDRRTRDDHKELDEKVVEKEASWTFEDKDGVTQTLKYPGDPDAPPEQTINCRCSMVWVAK
jgi:SPP1 gp7 family putative phage head morphogenesis protein